MCPERKCLAGFGQRLETAGRDRWLDDVGWTSGLVAVSNDSDLWVRILPNERGQRCRVGCSDTCSIGSGYDLPRLASTVSWRRSAGCPSDTVANYPVLAILWSDAWYQQCKPAHRVRNVTAPFCNNEPSCRSQRRGYHTRSGAAAIYDH